MSLTSKGRLAATLIVLALACTASAPALAGAQTHAKHATAHAQG
jgi:hypothetical protein